MAVSLLAHDKNILYSSVVSIILIITIILAFHPIGKRRPHVYYLFIVIFIVIYISRVIYNHMSHKQHKLNKRDCLLHGVDKEKQNIIDKKKYALFIGVVTIVVVLPIILYSIHTKHKIENLNHKVFIVLAILIIVYYMRPYVER